MSLKPLKPALVSLSIAGLLFTSVPVCFANNPDPPHNGHITGKTVVGGLLSLIIWPGIGQAINNDKGDKVLTHAVIGLFPPFRIWSGWDALVNRHGGYWKGRI